MAKIVCSDNTSLKEEVNNINKDLVYNGSPEKVI